MEVLVCLLVLGVAWGRQQAVSYQNFRASHGQGHPTYGADGSWSQSFGGGPRSIGKEGLAVLRGPFTTHQRFAAFPSSQSFVHQSQPFFSSGPQTHIHTSGPPQISSYQSSQLSYDPQPIPGNQNLVNSGGSQLYQSPTVTSFGPDVTRSSLPSQSYGNDRLPQFVDGVNQNYNEGIATSSPAHIEQQNYPVNGPVETFQSRGNEEFPRSDVHPTPIYNEFTERPRMESSPPGYIPEQGKPNYQVQNSGNSYLNEGEYQNYREPKRDFGIENREPSSQIPEPYNGPVPDLRNINERPITDLRTRNENPISDSRTNNRPLTDLRSHSERPSDLRTHGDRPLTDLRNNNGRPGSDLRTYTDRPLSEISHNERHPSDLRSNNGRPLSELRNDNSRPHFQSPGPLNNFGPGNVNQKSTIPGIPNKLFKPVQSGNPPLDRPQNFGSNSRTNSGPLASNVRPPGLNQGSTGSKPFNLDEKKPLSGGFNSERSKSDFSDEDKSQSFESDFQSSEIGGQSFEADIPDFGSDESYFNSQEGYGSFESSGERKGSYERPELNSPEEKRNNLKSDGGTDFQSSLESSRGSDDSSAEPRNNLKFRNEEEARHRIGEDKKINTEDKKATFPSVGDKKPPALRTDVVADKAFPSARTASTAAPVKDPVPLANTFNKKVPYVAQFRPSSYTGDKFVPFAPIEKPFPYKSHGPFPDESRLKYQLQNPNRNLPYAVKHISNNLSSIAKNVPVQNK